MTRITFASRLLTTCILTDKYRATRTERGHRPLKAGRDVMTPLRLSRIHATLVVIAGLLATFWFVAPASATSVVWGWGSDESGALGSATGPEECWGKGPCSARPLEIAGLTGAKGVASGEEYSVAVLENGTVKAWGSNSSNQLGDGYTYGQQQEHAAPVTVSGITGAVAVAAGNLDGMALLSNGTIKAWGENVGGELGDGKATETTTPVTVKEISNATAVAMGEEDSLALLSTGHVMAWGTDETGQLGTGDTLANRHVPKEVSGISTAVAIAAGLEHNLALLSNGTVMAWGNNDDGQLGNGEEEGPTVCKAAGYCAKTPVTVEGLSNVAAIAAGGDHSLALLKDGTVMAWGNNESGELGDDSKEESFVPVPVVGIKTAIAIAANEESSMALLENGEVVTWGANSEGQLGDDSTGASETCSSGPSGEPCSLIPVATGSIGVHVQHIAAGGTHDLLVGSL
ncbi:MAG TPA: hypothetical protein VMB05_12805 [Solirubrobacteraceae bacterium]|nr:hypothetical protein [Solirubrobacteraceae bacterium]